MKRKTYTPPQSRFFEIRTEQGICYSSGQQEQLDPAANEEGDVNANGHIEINNDITFE